MFHRLRIAGFKRFDEKGVGLELAPITLLLGPNSAGKSSVFQSLLCLSQSWERVTGVFDLATAGKRVDLGRFGQVLHRREGRTVDRMTLEVDGVAFTWEDSYATDTEGGETEATRHGELVSIGVRRGGKRRHSYLFNARTGDDRHSRGLTLASESISGWLGSNKHDEELLAPLLDEKVHRYLDWSLDDDDGLADSPECHPTSDPGSERLDEVIREFSTEEHTLWSETSAALDELIRIRRNLGLTTHVGGLRKRGERIYNTWNADLPWRVGASGERIADVLLSVEGSQVRTNVLLEAAEIPYRVVTRPVYGSSDAIEVGLEDQRPGPTAGNYVGLPDVGSGVAQILPIVIQLAALERPDLLKGEPLLMVEQPELHLHPRWQARLAKMFATACAHKTGGENRVQTIIETHSEHLVLALANEIRNGSLSKDDVSLLVFEDDSESGSSSIRRIRFDDDGRFLGRWPGGFFQERRLLLAGEVP